MSGTVGAEEAPQIQIRANENGGIAFGDYMHNNFHFILRPPPGGQPVRVFQAWNSWGWSTRSFTATDSTDPARKYRFVRLPGEWTKNGPSTHEVTATDFLITDINLIDGTWRVEPALAAGRAHRLMLTGVLEIGPSPQATEQKVWLGRATSNTKEIVLQKECVPILNGQSRR